MAGLEQDPLVDPAEGLGLADMEWPPAHWFNEPTGVEPSAPVQAAGGLPAPAPTPAPADWVPPEWHQPAALGGAPAPEPDPLAPAPAAAVDPTQTAQEPLFPFQVPAALQGMGAAPMPWEPDAVAPDLPIEQAAAHDAEALLGQGEEAVARRGVELEERQRQHVATRTLDEDTKNRQWAERNAATWRAKEAELAQERATVYRDMQALAKQGVNNDHWWETRSTGQKIAAFVSAIAGGLVSPYYGGRNSGLEMIQQAVEQDIETQKANLAQQRDLLGMRQGMLAQLTATNGDALRAEEALRLAAYENVAQRLDAEAAKLDPRGTQAQRLAQASLQVRAKQRAEAAAADKAALDRKKIEHDMIMDRARAADARAGRKETERHNRAMEKLRRDEMEAEKNARDAKSDRVLAPGTVTGKAVHGITYQTTGPDGQPLTLNAVEVGDPGVASKLNEVLEASKKKLDSLADIKAIGPGRNLVRDADKAIVQSAMAGIRIATQSLIPGIPSDKDAAIIDKAQGMVDPAGFWDLLDGEERQRVLDYVADVSVRETNTTLQQYLGPGASFQHTGRSVATPPVPEEKKTPEELRALMSAAPDDVTATPITTKRSSYSSPYLDAARAAVKADSDPISLEKTRADIVARLQRVEFVPSVENVRVGEELRKLVGEIDAKLQRSAEYAEYGRVARDRFLGN